MRPRVVVEPYAGSAAVSLAVLCGKDGWPPATWRGSKRRLAPEILGHCGITYPVWQLDRLILADPGPWGTVWRALSRPKVAAEVARILREWNEANPAALAFECARWVPDDAEDARTIAGWLHAQQWRGRESGPRLPQWPGPRQPGAGDLGWPQTRAARVELAARALSHCGSVEVYDDASSCPIGDARPGWFVYCDPPYGDGSMYGSEVADPYPLARAAADRGAVVAVSGPFDAPEGWDVHEMDNPRGSQPERLAVRNAPLPLSLFGGLS